MRNFLLFLVLSFFCALARAQNTDLPSPAANNQTLPAGSYVVAMDNTNQQNSDNVFNLKAYGLIVHLLNDSTKLKWVIKAGKTKDATDFSVKASPLTPVATTVTKKIWTTNGSTAATVSNSTSLVVGMTVTSGSAGIQAGTTVTAISGTSITLSRPATANINNKDADFTSYTYPVTTYNFKAGPFVIFASDTTGVAARINTFNSGISNANDKVKVYKTDTAVTVDVRYDMTGFIPKAAILDDGGNVNIHTDYMDFCNITSANYVITYGQNLLTDCYTFASEPHNGATGTNVDNAIIAIKRFVEFGGNFLAQCHAITNYENNPLGRFQTTNGVTVANSNAGTSITYANPDLSYSQFEGNFDISIGGSLRNWRLSGSGTHNFHKHSKATSDSTVIGMSVSKHNSQHGGLVFYLGNHKFDNLTSVTEINGIRMYMNAFLTPVTIAGGCVISEPYMDPLAAKLLSFQGSENNGAARLSWEVNDNESNRDFVLEKSTDGSTYSEVVTLPARNAAGKQAYQYIDRMSATKLYYRLRITDKTNVERQSRVILLQTGAEENYGMKLLNNPVTDRIGIAFTSPVTGTADIRVTDMTGQLKWKQQVRCTEGKNSLSLTLPAALPYGIYIIEVLPGSERFTAQFIKQGN